MTDYIPLINALVIALLGGGGAWLWRSERRLKTSQAELTEVDAVEKIQQLSLSLLQPLEVKILALEEQNQQLACEVKELRERLEQYIKDEAAYQAELHEKQIEIRVLRVELDEARYERDELAARVKHLEEVCRRAGINGVEGS